jgi:hypothetical protein
MVRVLYKDKLLIPILGIFDDTGDFKWSKHYRDNFLPFAKKFKSYFRWTNSYAVFLYGNQNKYSDVYYANGFCYRNEYLCAVTDINNNDVPNCWWITSKFLTMAGYVCVLSRKYIITDKVIGWINKILPENMQIR